ncbi:MAG: DUF5723 family protein [Bacteroidota bacterium]
MSKFQDNKSPIMIKKYLISAVFCIVCGFSFSQSEITAFTATGRGGAATTFVTDYQSLGINPSNLGWKSPFNDHIVSIGLIEGAYSVYSEALAKPDLKESITNFESEKFTYQEKVDAAQAFTEAGFAINVDLSLFAIAVQPNEKVGGFAFGIRERIQWYSIFNKTISDILFMGYNADYFTSLLLDDGNIIPKTDSVQQLIESGDTSLINNVAEGLIDPIQAKLFSVLLKGSRISLSWYREYNFSYGRKIVSNDNFSLFGGIGLKYLTGMAILDVRAENSELEAFSAITPILDINYGDSAIAQTSPVEQTGNLPKSVGAGYGFDIGFSAIIKEKLKIGFAVNDIGSITWDGNVFVANDNFLMDMSSAGFGSYNLFQEAEDIVGENGVIKWDGITEKKTNLPTNIRAGASFQPSDKFEAGIDLIIPANDVAGNYKKMLFAFGLDVKPIPWLRLSTGITTGGNYGFNLPAGIAIILGEGTWEAGVASRDAITFFTENRPTLSLSAGFLRFRF